MAPDSESGARRLCSVPRRGVFALLLAAHPARAALAYPSRPVTLVVPFPIGGSTHVVAQLLARRLTSAFGQPFMLEVITGESGVAAMENIARAPPDGHRLLLSPNSSFLLPPRDGATPRTMARDLASAGVLSSTPLVLCASAHSRFRTLPELVEAARLAPGQLEYGSGGLGASSHLAVELFAQRFGIGFRHVAFDGGEAAMHAVVRNEVQFACIDLVTALPRIAGGVLRPLAVSSAQRIAPLPGVATLVEAGLPDGAVTADFALLAPKGTPDAILDRLCRASHAVMAAEGTRQLLAPFAIEHVPGSREDFPAYLAGQQRAWLALGQPMGQR